MATTYLTYTPASDGNRKTFTFSFWIKRSAIDSDRRIISTWVTAETKDGSITFEGGDLKVVDYNGSTYITNLITDRVFKDTSGWYHIVVAADTTQGVEANRVKLYINGVQETSFSTETYPAQDTDWTGFNEDVPQVIGRKGDSATQYFDGLMSHFYFIDGTAYPASTFGSTDSDTGEWVINTAPSVTYGTNGYLIMKNGNTITDQGDNSNDFTLGAGTLTNTEDCPDDVFATWNNLDNYDADGTFSNGNTSLQTSAGNESFNTSTLGDSKGKYYFEMKLISNSGSDKTRVGITSVVTTATDDWLGKTATSWGYSQEGLVTNDNSTLSGTFASYTDDDIIGIAMDLDNNRLFFSKNGTWQNSADPTSSTGALSITASETYFFGLGDETGGYSITQSNFGNGYFATTAISSAGTNASGIGIFEYDVPTGYTALSAKGMNS